jgi:predicted regulator of Ras-like GTPase activity (Roadblock/LC7/MglB family)
MHSPASSYEGLLHRLQELLAAGADVEYAAILTGDGVTLCSNFPKEIDEEQSALLLAASTAIAFCLVEALRHVIFECQNGNIIAVPLYDEMILVMMTRRNAKIGLIFLDVRRIFWQPTADLINPPARPKSLNAGAKPDYDDPN